LDELMETVMAVERAERRAAPSRPAIPSGDRPAYSPDEGHLHV
jgi:hypothetical protein